MRFLILLSLMMTVSQASFAEKIEVPKEHVLVTRVGKYETNQIRIFKDQDAWICSSNHFPYFEAKADPLRNVDWSMLPKKEESQPGHQIPCQDSIVIEDHRTSPALEFYACTDRPEGRIFIETLHKNCGRL